MLTQERLRELLHYEHDTGTFYWKVRKKQSKRRVGQIAGYVMKDSETLSYRVIKIDGRLYGAHRLVWLYITGCHPKAMLDHVNGDGLDNRFENLREASRMQNACNRRLDGRNTSGFKGVFWHKRHNKWISKIQVNRKSIHLGYFDEPAKAHEAYKAAAAKYHGEFARAD